MIEGNKICSVCQQEKPKSDFNKRKSAKDGHRSECRCCQSQDKKRYFEKNKEEYLRKASLPENRANHNRWAKEKRCKDPIWAEKQREACEAYSKSEKGLARRREWYRIPTNKIASNLRTRIRAALQGKTKSKKSIELLGADLEFVKKYIESKFLQGMTWENHGEWHIDHIIPCNFFDFSNHEHQKICFNYRNLQPMWSKDNAQKSDNITIDNVEEFIEAIRREIL